MSCTTNRHRSGSLHNNSLRLGCVAGCGKHRREKKYRAMQRGTGNVGVRGGEGGAGQGGQVWESYKRLVATAAGLVAGTEGEGVHVRLLMADYSKVAQTVKRGAPGVAACALPPKVALWGLATAALD